VQSLHCLDLNDQLAIDDHIEPLMRDRHAAIPNRHTELAGDTVASLTKLELER
jgi:hypothetical protein